MTVVVEREDSVERENGVEREKLGRREKNKIANRRAILDAGLGVFSSIGYEQATITDIVKASGLSVGTFYNYYGDKDSVFRELVDEFVVHVQHALAGARERATSMESFISDAYHAFSTLIFQNTAMRALILNNSQAFRRFVFGSEKIDAIFSEMENDMNKAIEAGMMPPFPVRLMVTAMIGAGAEVFAFEGDVSGATPDEKAEFLTNIFVSGIKGLAEKNT